MIVNVLGVGLVHVLLLDALLALIDIDVAVALVDMVVHLQNFFGGLHSRVSRLTVDLLLPEGDLLVGVKLDVFEFLPLALHCHFYLLNMLINKIDKQCSILLY